MKFFTTALLILGLTAFAQDSEDFIDPEKDTAIVTSVDVIDVPLIAIDVINTETFLETIQVTLVDNFLTSLDNIDVSTLTESQINTILVQCNTALSIYSLTSIQRQQLLQKISTLSTRQLELIAAGTNLETIDTKNFQIDTVQIEDNADNMKYVLEDNAESWKKGAYLAASLESQNAWYQTLLTNRSCSIAYVKETKLPRILSHIYLRKSQTFDKSIFEKNLEFAKERGYGAIHVLFDGNEDMSKTISTIETAKNSGFKIFMTYTSEDSKNAVSMYENSPTQLDYLLSVYAPLADGFILGWKKSSLHSNPMPKEFWNFFCKTLRQYNSTATIYGEAYYGMVTKKNAKKNVFEITMPENASGLVINNFGYSDYNYTYIVNKLLPSKISNFRKIAKLFQVIGPAPYYASSNDMNLSLAVEYSAKKSIENACFALGCGTITLVHDGVEESIENFYGTFNNFAYNLIQQ